MNDKRLYTCKICKEKFKSLEGLYSHIEEEHEEMIPKDMSVSQYYYFMRTGKSQGNCVICKGLTNWNETTQKYHRFCTNPKCKEKYKEEFRKRMIGAHGKVHLLNDPEQQKKMLANRSISGEYEWSSDPKYKIQYTGSYELDFLKHMDLFFNWEKEDIIMPSPHTYYYEYEGQKKFYIPDVFIPSLGLEIEIKDGGDNPNNHHKIQAVDKVKEKKKDNVLTSQKAFHYMKIVNKNYSNLIVFLHELKGDFEKYGSMDKIPRKFYIDESTSKPSKSVELVQVNESIDENFELEIVGEGTISFSFIKNLAMTKPMKYNGDKYFPDLDKFKYEYLKLIKSCNSVEELAVIKKDIANLKKFNNDLIQMGNQRYVNINVIQDLQKWIKYDVTYLIEDKEKQLNRSSFIGGVSEEGESIEIILTFDRSKTRHRAFSLFDTTSKVIINREVVLSRVNGLQGDVFSTDKYGLRDNECLVYRVNAENLKDFKWTEYLIVNTRPVARMFNVNSHDNQDFIAEILKMTYGIDIKTEDIKFTYSGMYKKYIDGGK